MSAPPARKISRIFSPIGLGKNNNNPTITIASSNISPVARKPSEKFVSPQFKPKSDNKSKVSSKQAVKKYDESIEDGMLMKM